MQMLTDRIKAMIRDFNPWWDGRDIIVPEYKRHIFANIEKYMGTKQIIAIVGLRRVGKTVLMKQAIKEINSKIKENVFYFLFDDLLAQNPEVLEDILEYYLKTIAKEGKKHIFLDEIQKVPYWQDVLKRFYDTNEDIKFVVSGSASLQIKKSKESLAGRIFDFYMPVLAFGEFLELNGIETEKPRLDFESLKKTYDANLHKKPVMEKMLLEYLFRGAFPEIAAENDDDIVKSYIKSSVLEKIIFDDIPAVFEVKRKDVLYSLLEYCGRETSGLLDITNLASTLNVNYHTAKAYLFYLEKSFLIDILYNYSKSAAKQLRKRKKVHIAHPSITITMMGHQKNILNASEGAGKYVESVVFQHAKLLSERICFWRSPQKEEVDIVLGSATLLPVEVKYRNRPGISELSGTLKFMKKHNLRNGICVTKDVLDEKELDDKKILFVPVWLFLLSCGLEKENAVP